MVNEIHPTANKPPHLTQLGDSEPGSNPKLVNYRKFARTPEPREPKYARTPEPRDAPSSLMQSSATITRPHRHRYPQHQQRRHVALRKRSASRSFAKGQEEEVHLPIPASYIPVSLKKHSHSRTDVPHPSDEPPAFARANFLQKKTNEAIMADLEPKSSPPPSMRKRFHNHQHDHRFIHRYHAAPTSFFQTQQWCLCDERGEVVSPPLKQV